MASYPLICSLLCGLSVVEKNMSLDDFNQVGINLINWQGLWTGIGFKL